MSGWLQAGTCFPRACANRPRRPARSMRVRRRCQTSLHDLSFAWVHPSRVSLLLCRRTFARDYHPIRVCRVSNFTESCLSLASIEGASRALIARTEGAKGKKCLAMKRGTHQSGGETRDAFDHAQATLTQGAARLGRCHRADTARYRWDAPLVTIRCRQRSRSRSTHGPCYAAFFTPPWLSPREWQSHPSAAAIGSRMVRARPPSDAPGFHPSGPA